jgi:hypothetical protein
VPGGATEKPKQGSPDSQADPGFRLVRTTAHFEVVDAAGSTVGVGKFGSQLDAFEHGVGLLSDASGPLFIGRVIERTYRRCRMGRRIPLAKPTALQALRERLACR